MQNLFCEGLVEADINKLLAAPKSDIHNHSSKGCRIGWLEEQLGRSFTKHPDRFNGLDGMHSWFSETIKPFCKGREGLILRWEGAFAEAQRNNILRLAMNFGVQDIELVGGMESFQNIIESFHKKYCPDMTFEPELTYGSFCNVEEEADRIDEYISSGFFKSIDVCGGEDVQPLEAFLPLYRKAEKYRFLFFFRKTETGHGPTFSEKKMLSGKARFLGAFSLSSPQEVIIWLKESMLVKQVQQIL
jgi:adenosine deaminase